MKYNNFLITLIIIWGLSISAAQQPNFSPEQEEKIEEIVGSIKAMLNYMNEEDRETLKREKNISGFINPTEGNTNVEIEAKRRVKAELFPTEEQFDTSYWRQFNKPNPKIKKISKSYWQQYAPQFMQNAYESTSQYIASWIPKSIRDRVNAWSTQTKLAVVSAALSSLALIYNRETLMKFIQNSLPNDVPEIY